MLQKDRNLNYDLSFHFGRQTIAKRELGKPGNTEGDGDGARLWMPIGQENLLNKR